MEIWKLEPEKWALSVDGGACTADEIQIEKSADRLYVKNESTSAVVLTYQEDVKIEHEQFRYLETVVEGANLRNGGACFYLNGFPVTLNGTSVMEIIPPLKMTLTLKVPGDSEVEITRITMTGMEENHDLVDDCGTDAEVLVITPDYPSFHNLYLCAFAHSRNCTYAQAGLKVQVAAISPNNWYQKSYEMDGIPVFLGRFIDLKKLLSRHQYKVIVVHFVDENLYPIFDGYVQDERLIFICHGPETVFRILTKAVRPYFTPDMPEIDIDPAFNKKEAYVAKYAQKDNVEWVFVSDWLRDKSEQLLGITFRHSRVINNTISKKYFPYRKKTAEDRKKILILRKFDNIWFHSIDQSVLAILELSRRDFFQDLTFEVYGDGLYYDTLVAPITHFSNVHLHRTFVPNHEIHKIHANNGILLIPSRHDAHAVAMSEGASSGLVVVGSNVTSNGFFMNNAVNHTLTDPEDPIALADVIERLYRNPDEFLEISERMSRETQARCSEENTAMKEVALIQEQIRCYDETVYDPKVAPEGEPVLTIVVPSCNVEKHLEKCLRSLINHRNVEKTEIIVVNDGSRDGTAEIAQRFSTLTNGVVRVINKENGGYGSTINVGIEAARGRYFRLIDGDDWVDSENLAKLVDRLEQETVDVVLTKGCCEYANQGILTNIMDYDMLHEGTTYHFDDLRYPGYGFEGYGLLLETSTYRIEVLKKTGVKVSEKRSHADMEFKAFSLGGIDTVRYFDLDIYRQRAGREDQAVSPERQKESCQDQGYVITNILRTINQIPAYCEDRKRYVYERITAPMIDSQIAMFGQLCLWDQIDGFLEELFQWPDARRAGLDLIEKKAGDSAAVLSRYQQELSKDSETPEPAEIVGESASQPAEDFDGADTEPAEIVGESASEPTEDFGGADTEPAEIVGESISQPAEDFDGADTEPAEAVGELASESAEDFGGADTEPAEAVGESASEPAEDSGGADTESAEGGDDVIPESARDDDGADCAAITEAPEPEAEDAGTGQGSLRRVKTIVKACLPYGLMKMILKRRYPGTEFPDEKG